MDKALKQGHIQAYFHHLCRKVLHNIYTGKIGTFYLFNFKYLKCLPHSAGMISVDPLTGATMSPRLLSSGKSCLDVSLTDLFVSLDPARLEEAREFASTPQSAAHIVLLSHFAELAQSIGQTFFTSAKDLHPTLTYEVVAREDGKYQLQNARMIMKGVANKHPFWSPGGSY
jgi:hypothetical protein